MFENYNYADTGTDQVPLSFDYLSIETVKNNLSNIDDISDKDLYILVLKTYGLILEEVFVLKNIELIKVLYNNPRFIMTLTSVLGNPEVEVTNTQKIWCNKLTYDYFTSNSQKDDHIKALLIKLSNTVNRSYTPGLIGLGLNETLVSYMVNARFSSEKEQIQVRRLNLIIANQSPDVMTVQMIVNIYGQLFDHITPLFDGIMYDVWSQDQLEDKNIAEVYSTITTAIIEIVNNLPIDIMQQLLYNFSESYRLLNNGKPVRFNIYAICQEDYPRLYMTLESLKQQGVYLPSL